MVFFLPIDIILKKQEGYTGRQNFLYLCWLSTLKKKKKLHIIFRKNHQFSKCKTKMCPLAVNVGHVFQHVGQSHTLQDDCLPYHWLSDDLKFLLTSHFQPRPMLTLRADPALFYVWFLVSLHLLTNFSFSYRLLVLEMQNTICLPSNVMTSLLLDEFNIFEAEIKRLKWKCLVPYQQGLEYANCISYRGVRSPKNRFICNTQAKMTFKS